MATSPELESFLAADRAWSEELNRLYGTAAGNVRYLGQGKGEEGSELRRLYVARQAAMKAWEQARARQRAEAGQVPA